ncbi:hypothetical protein JVU11DRAFT_7773 [Chiua virens]|nr:hypothetical protein JVU11DRAFT_7773 [Chiua virens]
MSSSASSPSQSSVSTLDESHTRPVKSPAHACTSANNTTRTQPIPPASSSQPLAPPTPSLASSLPSTGNTSTSPIQSKAQPNSPSRSMSTKIISFNSSPSCLTLSEPAASLRRDELVKVLSERPDSGMADPISLSTKSRHSITPSFSFPGALSSTTTSVRNFPDSADSHCTLTSTSSTDSITATSQQTPNVYINGLPAHCSEQDLFALARPFGNIKSVRTFTRHVSDKPTGYGFVLFGDIESARKCIEGLRKLRNIHPSFSKQIHRIPGTEYAQHSAVQSTDQDENSFKSRMDKLKDFTSTNLYIEGLPLSIDEESLSALMKPHKIKSSRFFPTKLSNPPRIIAFVRLESRAAAVETIECLHGRMVRGWNDPGCRISVRFADSADQRELRRTERSQKSGDQSPSRLTIARAALLNLRGQQLQPNIRDVAGPWPQRLANAPPDNQAIISPGSDSGLLPTSRSLPSTLCYPYGQSPLLSTSNLPLNSEMDTLLQSVQHMGFDDGVLDGTMRVSALDNEHFLPQQTQSQAVPSAALLSPDPPPITLPRGHTQAHNGFTPAEQLILEVHAKRLQLQAQLSNSSSLFEPMIPSLRKISANVRNFDPASHEPFQASALPGMATFDTLPTISEDDFHAVGHSPSNFAHEYQGIANSYPPNVPATTNTIFMRPPSRAVSIVPPPPDYEEPGKRPKAHNRVERSTPSKQISYPPSFNTRQPQAIPSSESKPKPTLLQASTRQDNRSSTADRNNNTSTISYGKNIDFQHAYMYSHGDARSCPEDKVLHFRASSMYAKNSPQVGEHHPTVKEAAKSPTIVSPALTYSSRTPSTLSPATPFFGSFTGNQDTFEVMAMESEELTERKQKARVANR